MYLVAVVAATVYIKSNAVVRDVQFRFEIGPDTARTQGGFIDHRFVRIIRGTGMGDDQQVIVSAQQFDTGSRQRLIHRLKIVSIISIVGQKKIFLLNERK